MRKERKGEERREEERRGEERGEEGRGERRETFAEDAIAITDAMKRIWGGLLLKNDLRRHRERDWKSEKGGKKAERQRGERKERAREAVRCE